MLLPMELRAYEALRPYIYGLGPDRDGFEIQIMQKSTKRTMGIWRITDTTQANKSILYNTESSIAAAIAELH